MGSDSRATFGIEAVAERFAALGGVFLTPPGALASKLEAVRGLVFDWDGVFNRGVKGEGSASTFSEADSMGTNLLRYALWRRDGSLPSSAIITGELNPSARRFVDREHFDALYQGIKDKGDALESFRARHGLARRELVCVFDDVNDLAMAEGCGVRMLVRRSASPLLGEYVAAQGAADYITGNGADAYAVREIAELLIGLMGAFTVVVESRVLLDERYRSYFDARQAIKTELERHG